MKKQFIISFGATAALLLSASPAFAVTSTRMERIETKEAVLEQRKANIEQKIDQKCETVTQRVQLVTTRYKNNYSHAVTAYQRMKSSVEAAVTKLTAKGYDTSKLKTDLQTLDGKIAKFDSDYKAVMAQLEVTKKYACGESQGQFKTEMEKARQLAKTAQADMLDVRTFYQTTIRPDLQALRAQKPAASVKP